MKRRISSRSNSDNSLHSMTHSNHNNDHYEIDIDSNLNWFVIQMTAIAGIGGMYVSFFFFFLCCFFLFLFFLLKEKSIQLFLYQLSHLVIFVDFMIVIGS